MAANARSSARFTAIRLVPKVPPDSVNEFISQMLEEKLQRDLDLPLTNIRLDLPKGRRFDVADRQPKIGVVQHIEQLPTELKLFRFRQSNVLESREIPVHVSRTLDCVSAFVPKLLHRRIRVLNDWLKGALVEPLRRGMRPGIGIANNIRPVAGKSGNLRRRPLHRNIVGVEYREGRAAHGSEDSVQLPVAQNVPVPALRMLQERKAPLITEHEAMAGIEHRPAALRREIEGILRQVVLSGCLLRGRPRNVE